MARYIMIDAHTGYVFGDTADINGRAVSCDDIIEAARTLDTEVIGGPTRTYREVHRSDLENDTGYHIYRADVGGSEAVPVVTDGQDRETIQAVLDHCEYAGSVACESEE